MMDSGVQVCYDHSVYALWRSAISNCLLNASYFITASGGYSNLGTRGKNFKKLMLSEKKKRSDLGLHIFLPKSKCSLKKKKRSSL